MSKIICHEKLTDTTELTECDDGFWLYDHTQGMNLSMRAKSAQAAYAEALTYYQNRLIEVESNFNSLNQKVQSFVAQFINE